MKMGTQAVRWVKERARKEGLMSQQACGCSKTHRWGKRDGKTRKRAL
jgi:hypothetical protein